MNPSIPSIHQYKALKNFSSEIVHLFVYVPLPVRLSVPPALSQVIPAASEEQLLLVELVRSVSAMRTETVMQTVKEVLKQPPAIAKEKVGVACSPPPPPPTHYHHQSAVKLIQ